MSGFRLICLGLLGGAAVAAALPLPALALSVTSVDAPTRRADRECNASRRTEFNVRIAVRGSTADDGRNRDAYLIYLLDGDGQILDSRGRRQGVGTARTRTERLRTMVDPRSGPFRVVVVDSTDTRRQANGQSLSATPVATRSFDAHALDPDCPEATAVANTDDAVAVILDAVDAQTSALATAGLLQPAALTLGRLRRLSMDSPLTVNAGPGAGLFGLETGGAGQAAPTGFNLWADATWSQLQPEAAGGGETDSITAAIGGDMAVTGEATLGLAVFGGYGVAEGRDVKTTERSVGVSPYLGIRFGAGFSLNASGGYSYASGETSRAAGAGDYTAHRIYGAVEAAHFAEAGAFSMLSSVGVLYGRSARGGFTDSGGLTFGGDRTATGSAHLLVQPGYTIRLTPEAAITPFLHAEYRRELDHDAGTQPDSARFGGGLRLDAGAGLSGRVEAIRGVGAGGDDEMSVRAYFAYDF